MPSYLLSSPKHTDDKSSPNKTRRLWGITLVTALFTLLVFYVIQTNSLATKGYEIRALEQQVKHLEKTYEEFEIKASELQSLKKVEESKDFDKFVSIERVEYLAGTPTVSGVAIKP
ncbi:MAG: hypothetical protein ABIJ81_00345 [Patescibacteria group bacterium]